jgi:hypothetical protein
MTRDEIIASNLSEVEKANERIKMLEDKLASIKQAIAELESQEPVAWGVDWGKAGDIACVSIIKRLPNDVIEVVAVEYAPYSYTHPPRSTEQNFCSRCGKRTADLTTIHTCTPPKEGT